MESRRFVRVEAVKTDGTKLRGTGYRIRQNRILTAWHVVEEASSIAIFFENKDGPASGKVEVAWSGSADLDACLLSFDYGVETMSAYPLGSTPLDRKIEWVSRGWAMASDTENSKISDAMIGLWGQIPGLGDHPNKLELEVQAPPEEVNQWRGISGAPVIVDGWIVGVIMEAPKPFLNRLYAVPVHRLMADEGFQKALGLDLEAERLQKKRAKLLEKIRRLLEDDAEAANTLAEQREEWRAIQGREGIRSLAFHMCWRTPFLEAVHALNHAHGELAERRSLARVTIEEIVDHLVPLIYERDLLVKQVEPGSTLIRLPVKTSTIAEIAMAGFHLRPMAFREGATPGSKPSPRGAIIPPACRNQDGPERGIDPDSEIAFYDLLYDLAQNVYRDSSTFENDTIDSLFTSDGRPREDRQAEAEESINGHIEFLANDAREKLQYYLLCDHAFVEQKREYVEKVRSRLGALKIAVMTSDSLTPEFKLTLAIRELLGRRFKNHGGEK